MKLFFFDTETTGISPKFSRIIQFGGIFGELSTSTGEFTELERINQFVNIKENIPLEASNVHGIYKEDLVNYEYMDAYIEQFLGYLQEADFVIGHNVTFDKNMLRAEAERYKIPFDFEKIRWIDTMKSTITLVNPRTKKWPKLQELYRFLFGKEFADAHDAMADIVATQQCFCHLVKTTKIFDSVLQLSSSQTTLRSQKKDKNQISSFGEPDIEDRLDLTKLKNKRGDNTEALKFLNLVEQGEESIFLTGKAGSGKSTLIKDLIDTAKSQNKRPLVLGSTGISALNIGGQTAHSFFSLGIEDILFKDLVYFIKDPENKKFKLNREKIELLRHAPFIIIDEISMLSSNTIDCINVLMTYYLRSSKTNFGNKQMIFVGDLYQLPPVKTNEWIQKFKDIYQSEWFFDSFSFQKLSYTAIELTKNYRQKEDKILTQILDHIRQEKLSDEDLSLLNNCCADHLDSESIILSTHRHKVENINTQKLSELKGKSYEISAESRGHFPQNMRSADEVLTLKVGAKVMLTTNDTKGRWINGSIGTILDINPHKGTILLQIGSETHLISKHTRVNSRTHINEDGSIEEEILGYFTQLPLQLAYAITIHKSQGLTFESCQIDLNDTFVGGQAYTALSRVSSLKGLKIRGEIKYGHLFFDQNIQRFLNRITQKQ